MILVVADDFSGAAEVAGVAHQCGLSAEVHTDELGASDCDVVVVDANTRSLSPELAANRIRRLIPMIDRANPLWLFKKVDSALRGSVLSEMDALTDGLGLSCCLLINANPRKGRVVRGGELFIEDQPIHRTDFANDPEHPCASSGIADLLRAPPGQVQVIDRAEQIKLASANCQVHVANVDSSEEFSQYTNLRTGHYLLAGGAEFFESLLSAELGTSATREVTPLALYDNTLFVRGTSVRRSDHDYPNVEPVELVTEDLNVEQTIEEVAQQLAERSFAMIANGVQRDAKPADISRTDPEMLHRRLIDVVGRICDRCHPKHLWIEGGRTASGLVRARGWRRLRVQCVYGDGVVGLRAIDHGAPSLVVKPGSYRWPVVASA